MRSYSGLTPTVVLRYLNRMLGSLVHDLELTQDEMMRVVFQETLTTYSKYFPYRYKEVITSEHQMSKEYSNVYILPNEDRLHLIGVHNAWINNTHQYGGHFLPLINNPMQTQLMQDMLSAVVTRPTFEFQAPNILTLRPKIDLNYSALVELKAVHPRHLKTIELDMRDDFLKLCYYDVLISIYPLRHRFNTLTTPYGQIDLFTDQVDIAKDEREALLDKFRDNFLKASNVKKIYFA